MMLRISQEGRNPLVTSRPGNFLAIIIQHCLITPLVIGSSQIDNLCFPMPFLSHEAVDLIVEIADLVVGESGCEENGCGEWIRRRGE